MTNRHLCIVALCLLGPIQLVLADNANNDEEIGLRAEELAALRGWNTVNHDVQISDGYIVNVLELVNPNMSAAEANKKDPVIFFHGIQLEGNCWLINSAGASPKNYANRNASAMSPQQLDALIGNDPTSGSFAFTASNFAHRTFIVNRRGTVESRNNVDPTKQACLVNPNTPASYAAASKIAQTGLSLLQKAFNSSSPQQSNLTIGLESDFATGKLYRNYSCVADNPRYWNYSFDQQAARDVIEILKFVLNLTGKQRASLVGHSAGGALILMALTVQPEIARNVSHAIVWAPALDLKTDILQSRLVELFEPLDPVLNKVDGPFLPDPLVPVAKQLLVDICSDPTTRQVTCASLVTAAFGPSGTQQILTPGFVSIILVTEAAKEISQLLQSARYGLMHYFDYEDPVKNKAAYGSILPPVYDITRIISKKLAFYYGNKDELVTPTDVNTTIARLSDSVRRASEIHFINGPNTFFNHLSFYWHQDVYQLLVRDSLRTLESS